MPFDRVLVAASGACCTGERRSLLASSTIDRENDFGCLATGDGRQISTASFHSTVVNDNFPRHVGIDVVGGL
jgi:hypothetical protein